VRRFLLLLPLLFAAAFIWVYRTLHEQPAAYAKYPVAEEKRFVVIIPSYNNSLFCERNLFSVLTQSYENFRVIYIDDASTDDTQQKVALFIEKMDPKKRVTLIRNPKNVGALENIYRAVHSCSKKEIVILVDGDDFLAHDGVLAYLNRVYANPYVWMTYGSFVEYPDMKPSEPITSEMIPLKVLLGGRVRRYPWRSSHLRSFYAGLFQKIHKEDLLWEGKFLPMGVDLAVMFPLLEMSGSHARYVDKVLYLYNRANPLNNCKIDLRLQQQLGQHIRALPPYPALQDPPF